MKRKKSLATLVIALVFLCGLTIGVHAADTLKEIKAYLNYGISIQYNGETQVLKGADGSTVYPITYNNSTYLPIRSISNIFGVPVDWDEATQTVLLGSAGGTDLIENFVPYTKYGSGDNIYDAVHDTSSIRFVQSKDGQSTSAGGETVNHWIAFACNNKVRPESPCSFNVGGKYDALSFKVYSEKDMVLYVRGDNDSILGQFNLTGGQVPQTFTVDLHGTTQLTFEAEKVETEDYIYSYSGGFVYTTIFNAVLDPK